MELSVYILAFSTSNYDVMKKFFIDFGFTVEEDPHDQLTPFFESGRASNISKGGFEFLLEESSSGEAKACFNLYLPNYTSEEIEKLRSLGYDYKSQTFFSESHYFRSPDGGIISM